MKKIEKKQLQHTSIIKKIGKNQNQKKYQKKRHTIEGQDNTSLGKSNELIKTNRKKD